jgi:hypothetical protein
MIVVAHLRLAGFFGWLAARWLALLAPEPRDSLPAFVGVTPC